METEQLINNESSTNTVVDDIETKVNDIETKVNDIETKVDDIDSSANDIITETIKQTLIQLIQKLLKDQDKLKSININLTQETVLFIEKLLELEPQLFSGIEISLQQIISDNKINSNDIPDLLVLIAQVYEIVNKSNKDTLKNIDYYELVKNILHIVFSVYIENHCDKDQLILLQYSLRLIDSSIELIKLRGFSKEVSFIKKMLNKLKKCSCKC